MDSPMIDDKRSPRVSQLKQLMMDDDEGLDNLQNDESATKFDDADFLLNDDSELETTDLGAAIDSLMLSWTQMLTNTATRHTPQPPTIEHVKETAEVYVKHFRDSCHDVNAELATISLQWKLDHPEETLDEQTTDLSKAIARQKTLLGRVPGILSRRMEEYFSSPE